jgi:hypothetical protein
MSGDRYSRQSFLGKDAEERFATCIVGVVGLGGGGSHIVQQLAHVGFQNFVLYDGDTISDSNLNRLVGGTEDDVQKGERKIAIAERMIRSLQPHANVDAHPQRWQEDPVPLRSCDLIFGCVDSLSERRELEMNTRRYLIPYIDIGLEVRHVAPEPPVMAGQVILSMPDHSCLTRMGLLTEQGLAAEAVQYGDAGPRPQVVWGNGVLASLAVDIAVDLITGWTQILRTPIYLVYEANSGSVSLSKRLDYLSTDTCSHFSLEQVGDVVW